MNEIQSQAGIDKNVKERIVLADDSSSNWTSGTSSDGKEWKPEVDELNNHKNQITPWKYEPESNKCEKRNCCVDYKLALGHEFPFLSRWDRNESPVNDQEEDAREKTKRADEHVEVAFWLFKKDAVISTVMSNGYFYRFILYIFII